MVYKDIRETSSGLYRGMFSFFVPGILVIDCRLFAGPVGKPGLRSFDPSGMYSFRSAPRPGLHPALQTSGLLKESYYVLLITFNINSAGGGALRRQNLGVLKGSYCVLLITFVIESGQWRRPASTKPRSPKGVLLCFVDYV
jgi:hypothetical protein